MNDKSMNTMKVKQTNRNMVYRYIFDSKITCKLDITKGLNMGLSTVNQNLKSLEQDGLIEKNGFFESTGGRKADAIQIVTDAKISIGIAILKDSFDLVAVNLYGDIIVTKLISCKFQNCESYFKFINDCLNQFIGENEIMNVLGVSIAVQGIISRDGNNVTYGKILDNENMKLENFTNFIKYPCRMEHDSKAVANLELWNNKDIKNAAVFLLNMNLGGAIISDRKVQNGDNMHMGIIEHICIDDKGEKCYCGLNGCLETFCSGTAIKKISDMDLHRFFDLVVQNNKICIDIWEKYLDKLAYAIRILSTIIDGKIIISGYIAWYISQSDVEYLIAQVNRNLLFKLKISDIIVSKQAKSPQAIGAALYYIKSFLKNV